MLGRYASRHFLICILLTKNTKKKNTPEKQRKCVSIADINFVKF